VSLFSRDERNLHLKRVVVLVAAMLAVTSLLALFSDAFYFIYDMKNGRLLPIAGLGVAASIFGFLYLQSGGNVSRSVSESGIDPHLVNVLFEENDELRKKTDFILERLERIQVANNLSEEDRESVLAEIVRQSGPDAIKEMFEVEARRYKAELMNGLGLERLTSFSRSSVDRLKREISDLRLRSNINLLIGMLITAGGLWLLWSTVTMLDASDLLKVLASEGNESNVKFFKNLILPVIPRVLLVIFVEVFAYFFLRLYRNGLSEIKYFQNELTNIEAKLTAAEFAFVTKNDEALKFAIECLSKTERNFVLEKGQTTVDLERAKSESQLSKDIIKIIPDLFKGRK